MIARITLRQCSGRLEYGEFLAAAVERRIYSQYLDQLDRAFDKCVGMRGAITLAGDRHYPFPCTPGWTWMGPGW